MSYWDRLIRKDNKKCYESAYLETRTKSGITKEQFNFEVISSDSIVLAQSSLPMDYDKRTITIFTYCTG
jgi:hypothetical protein